METQINEGVNLAPRRKRRRNGRGEHRRPRTLFSSEEDDEEEPKGLAVVSREEWGAEPAKFCKKMEPPCEVVHVTFSNTEECFDRESCFQILQRLQHYHMTDMNLPDIAWNFIFTSDGAIYEGRGWECEGYKPALVKKKYGTQKLVEFGYIGDFENQVVSNAIEVSSHRFVRQAVKNGKISIDYTMTAIRRKKDRYQN